MSRAVDELKRQALMQANKMKAELGPEQASRIEEAYARVKQIDGLQCHICWIWDDVLTPLEKVGFANDVDIYECERCEFKGSLLLSKE